MDADGKVLTPLDEAAVADGGEEAAGAGLRGGRHPFPAQLHQPGARAARGRDRARPVAQPLCHARATPSCRNIASSSAASRRRSTPRCSRCWRATSTRLRTRTHGQGLRSRHPGDAGQRRHDLLAAHRPGGREHGDVGPGLGRDGGGLYRPRLGPAQPDHLRYGRHLDRCRSDRGRRARRSRASSSSNTPCRSTCRWSTCTRSARAAARSPRSMPPACCGSGRRAPARGRGRSATAAAAPSPPSPTPT